MTAAVARMSTKQKVLFSTAILFALMIGLYGIFGSAGPNMEFQPQSEFMLTPWIEIRIGGLDLSITKGVFYVAVASALTCLAMVYIAKRMQDRPNRVQTAVEMTYDLTFNQIVRSNMQAELARKWFPFIATIFFFILISNLIGYIPLPTNTEHPIMIGSLEIPSLAIYAATANVSVPLILTLVVWLSYHVEGIRAKGVGPYFKGWLPADIGGGLAVLVFPIEVISQLVRIISLSVRLFANLLAGHLLILFMGGGLVVILGIAALGPLTLIVAIIFFIFEVILIAGLQAFIFATLTAIYLGEATEGH
jgi:F-type H+-transporting ATPase subunit a